MFAQAEAVVIAALFIDERPGGAYVGLDGVDAWGISRDARKYDGPHPVVCHPPCHLWVNFAALNFKRYGGEHNRPGNDGGCFASALASVRRWGGVLEHPAGLCLKIHACLIIREVALPLNSQLPRNRR